MTHKSIEHLNKYLKPDYQKERTQTSNGCQTGLLDLLRPFFTEHDLKQLEAITVLQCKSLRRTLRFMNGEDKLLAV